MPGYLLPSFVKSKSFFIFASDLLFLTQKSNFPYTVEASFPSSPEVGPTLNLVFIISKHALVFSTHTCIHNV